jgi:hypothetical protein
VWPLVKMFTNGSRDEMYHNLICIFVGYLLTNEVESDLNMFNPV